MYLSAIIVHITVKTALSFAAWEYLIVACKYLYKLLLTWGTIKFCTWQAYCETYILSCLLKISTHMLRTKSESNIGKLYLLLQYISFNYFTIPYSGKISRTINFTVFKDFTKASKINSSKSYHSIESYDKVDPWNLIRNI